jgi:hypothetical protein
MGPQKKTMINKNENSEEDWESDEEQYKKKGSSNASNGVRYSNVKVFNTGGTVSKDFVIGPQTTTTYTYGSKRK